MALQLKDRVIETASAPGTGTVTLLGASLGYQSFNAALTSGSTTYYTIADLGGSSWEVGVGTFTSPNQLARNTVLASSNSGSLVNFTAGTQNVFITYPAEKSVNLDGSGNVNIPAQLNLVNTALTSSNTSNLNIGGPLSFSDTGIISDFVATTNSYLQAVIQNKSNGSSASSEFIAYNDAGTASTNYATVGINSSTYSGTGSVNAAGYGYFLTGSTDLVIGTIGANSLHITTNSQATDAVTINTSNAIAFNGAYGTAGSVLTSAGSGAPPTWATPTVSAAGSNTQVQYNNSGVLGASSSFTYASSTLTAPYVSASGGFHLNALTIATSYTIPSGSSASSVGPLTFSAGVAITVSAGSRWVVL